MGSLERAAGVATLTHVTRIGAGMYRVDIDGRLEVIYVAGRPGDLWAFWNGRVFRAQENADATRHEPTSAGGRQALSAPMPATVLGILVEPGARVRKGETVVILEAMKMELPLRSPADATVVAVHCRTGDLVQPDTVLVDLE
jgi:acetyl/propionyl-CoA carboxylase alpha subunit